MMQTMNPYTPTTTTAKTAEIMARYRPIAPKPEAPISPTDGGGGGGGGDGGETAAEPPKIQQSAYLRNVWPHLQARPTRTRKRGRTSLAPPPSVKRSRSCLQGLLSPPFHVTNSPPQNLSLQGFSGAAGLIPLSSPTTTTATLVTLPLLPCPSTFPMECSTHIGTHVVDLNRVSQIPEEKDFLTQLTGSSTTNAATVISPRPLRPIGSSISIWSVQEDPKSTKDLQIQQKAKEVEEELESEGLPAVISDSKNKVRLVNSSYKEMVGQPVCPWLDSMVTNSTCKRICGEVTLQFHHPDTDNVLVSSNGFSCKVSVEWGNNGKKATINAFGEVTRLFCDSKDYLFAWKLHTNFKSVKLVSKC